VRRCPLNFLMAKKGKKCFRPKGRTRVDDLDGLMPHRISTTTKEKRDGIHQIPRSPPDTGGALNFVGGKQQKPIGYTEKKAHRGP